MIFTYLSACGCAFMLVCNSACIYSTTDSWTLDTAELGHSP